jgi:hemolysin D
MKASGRHCRIGQRVDFRRATAARAANGLIFLPPFPPEAERCAFTAEGLREDLIKARERTQLQALTSPVDGVVQQLAAHTIGGVVTPAQALLAVAPADSDLEIEAVVSNRDIGFIHAGQEAEIKIDSFNFTRYGLIHGRVEPVAGRITREAPKDLSNYQPAGADNGSSEPKGLSVLPTAPVLLTNAGAVELHRRRRIPAVLASCGV